MIPENIHTPTMEGKGNSKGGGGGEVKDPGNSKGDGGLYDSFSFQRSIDSIQIRVSI